MKKINEKLSELFNVEPIEMKEEEKKGSEIIVPENLDPVESDTDFARKNIKKLIEKGSDAIDEILLVAKNSEHPRAYEVAGALIKSISDLNKDLLELQKRKKDLQISTKGGNSSNNNLSIDKAVFVGSTSELMKILKQKG
jgi:hypothetical protein